MGFMEQEMLLRLPISEFYITPHLPGYNSSPDEPYNGYGMYANDFGQKNGARMGAYHRLDLGIQFHKKKKWGERTWEISAYNVYNRKNPFFYYSTNETRNNKTYGVLKQVSLFPIIPSITYSFRF